MPEPPERFRQQLDPAAPEPPKRKRGRPRKHPLPPTPVKPAPAPSPATAPSNGATLTGVDAMKYLIARFVQQFANDPIALNRALVDVQMAEQGKRPPTYIEVPWSTAKYDWKKVYEDICARTRGRPCVELEPKAALPGRPKMRDFHWTDASADDEGVE